MAERVGVIVERLVETHNEQVRSTIYTLAQLVENEDLDGVLGYVSDSNLTVKSRVKSEMPKYVFNSCRVLGFNEFEIESNHVPPRSTVEFVVWANGRVKGGDGVGAPIRRAIKLYLQKEADGRWRFYNYEHYDPVNKLR